VEKHCQELFPRIAAQGHEIMLARRSSYVSDGLKNWQGVKLVDFYTPHRKAFEAITHTFLALMAARGYKPEIVHIHAIGPSLLTPLARLMGYTVVITNHGPDYDRQKWGGLAKFMLRLGEKMGGLFANEVIVISNVIAEIIKRRCHRESNLIYNGVPLPVKSRTDEYIRELNLEPGHYVLAVARLVPEKGLHDLLSAFEHLRPGFKLVIAGDADHESEYSRELKARAAANPSVVMTGYVTGEPLNQLYTHAMLFVLPSYHEGLPIVLLEAMSYGLPVLVSDIPANKEVGLPQERYFRCGDVGDLKEKMTALIERDLSSAEREKNRVQVETKYNWGHIAGQTIAVYRKALRQ
jgi:glycosyltransferase involved in cell wall biosynthesis